MTKAMLEDRYHALRKHGHNEKQAATHTLTCKNRSQVGGTNATIRIYKQLNEILFRCYPAHLAKDRFSEEAA